MPRYFFPSPKISWTAPTLESAAPSSTPSMTGLGALQAPTVMDIGAFLCGGGPCVGASGTFLTTFMTGRETTGFWADGAVSRDLPVGTARVTVFSVMPSNTHADGFPGRYGVVVAALLRAPPLKRGRPASLRRRRPPPSLRRRRPAALWRVSPLRRRRPAAAGLAGAAAHGAAPLRRRGPRRCCRRGDGDRRGPPRRGDMRVMRERRAPRTAPRRRRPPPRRAPAPSRRESPGFYQEAAPPLPPQPLELLAIEIVRRVRPLRLAGIFINVVRLASTFIFVLLPAVGQGRLIASSAIQRNSRSSLVYLARLWHSCGRRRPWSAGTWWLLDDVEREYPALAMDWGSIRKTWWLFFGAAGGCGYRDPRVVGQPTAAAIAGLRGRPTVKAAIQPRCFASACPNNNSPDRSSSPSPGAPCASRRTSARAYTCCRGSTAQRASVLLHAS